MLTVFNNDVCGPTIEIGIAQSQPLTTTAVVTPQNTVWIKAIADTGATATCICASVAANAGLPVIGKGNIQSASHVVAVNLFYGDLWIRGRNTGGSIFIWPFRNRVFTELSLPGQSNEALLGMDIFREGILMVHGPEGKTTFAW